MIQIEIVKESFNPGCWNPNARKQRSRTACEQLKAIRRKFERNRSVPMISPQTGNVFVGGWLPTCASTPCCFQSSSCLSGRTHTHTHAHTHTHTNAHTHTQTRTRTHTNAHTNTHTHTQTRTYTKSTGAQTRTHTHTDDSSHDCLV